MNTIHALYFAAVDADEAWQRELSRLFGKRAGDVRYTAKGKGAYGSHLNSAYLEWQRAQAAWTQAIDNHKLFSILHLTAIYFYGNLLTRNKTQNDKKTFSNAGGKSESGTTLR